MDEKTLIYLASQVDQGSYVGIMKTPKQRYSPVLRIRRSNDELIRAFHQAMPGYYRMNNTGCWIVYQGKKAIAMLRALYPHLKVKQAHADVIFELAAEVEKYKADPSRLHKQLNAQEVAVREELKLKLQQLNQGKDADPAPEPIPSIFD